MKAKLIMTGILAMVVLLAGACSSAIGSPKQTKVEVSYDEFMQEQHISKQVDVTAGSEILIELASNASTGFTWSEAVVADPSVVSRVGSNYVAPETGTVGAAGTQVWTFNVEGKGTTTVNMEYSRPWQGGEQAQWTFELTVNVQ